MIVDTFHVRPELYNMLWKLKGRKLCFVTDCLSAGGLPYGEYMRKAVGGTISIGVKYIKQAAQQLLFNVGTKSRSITYTPTGSTATATATATSVVTGGQDLGQYVGIAFYAPDMVDGTKKFTCVFVKKCLFGPPSMSLQTMGESIQFNTPTTSGEFLADDSAAQDLFEVAIVDDENEAKAWITAVLA